jgi:hypothetical protein
MTAYWIAHVEVTDPEAYGRYAKAATEPIEARGGRFLARSGRYVQLEGNDRARNVVVEFRPFPQPLGNVLCSVPDAQFTIASAEYPAQACPRLWSMDAERCPA